MICPKCGAEYRPGFTRCADCEVDLVAGREGGALAAFLSDGAGETGKPGDPNDDPFCSFWKGTDARICTELCAVLDEAGIPHKTIHRQDHLFNLASQVPYEVGVPASRYEAAESAVKEAFGSDEETGLNAMAVLPPPKEDARAGSLRTVWLGYSALQCATVCRELKGAGIHYRLAESRRSFSKRVVEGYAIGVAEEDYNRAIEITEGIVFTDRAEDDDEPEDPEMALKADDSGELENVSFVKDGDWYPEDATSLVWDGNPPDFRGAIEMGIAENDIRMRWAVEGGRARLFVLPEQERLAKRIVKEVLEGTPQE
jgi:hypothetical protein